MRARTAPNDSASLLCGEPLEATTTRATAPVARSALPARGSAARHSPNPPGRSTCAISSMSNSVAAALVLTTDERSVARPSTRGRTSTLRASRPQRERHLTTLNLRAVRARYRGCVARGSRQNGGRRLTCRPRASAEGGGWLDHAPISQRLKQEVKIDHALIRMPPGNQLFDSRVVQLCVYVKEAPELVVCSDVVSGEYVQTAQAAKQHVLGAPATYAAQAFQALDRRSIIKLFKPLEVQIAADDRPRGFDDRAGLPHAEAVTLEIIGTQGCELLGGWERARSPRAFGRRASLGRGEAVEQIDANCKGELLARDGVDQRLENGGKSRRLQAAQTFDERT